MSSESSIELKQGGAGTGRVWMRATCRTCGASVFQAGASELPPPLDSFRGLLRRFDQAAREHACTGVPAVQDGAARHKFAEKAVRAGARSGKSWKEAPASITVSAEELWRARLKNSGVAPEAIEKRARRRWYLKHDRLGYYLSHEPGRVLWAENVTGAKSMPDWEIEFVHDQLAGQGFKPEETAWIGAPDGPE